jgi:hypothetical protein
MGEAPESVIWRALIVARSSVRTTVCYGATAEPQESASPHARLLPWIPMPTTFSFPSSPHFSNLMAHRAAESGKSCFAITTCADTEMWPDADGV